METFDFIIVGSGPGGSVLAQRLTADSSITVLIIEAGPPDDSYLIRMPKGFGRLLTGSPYVDFYPTEKDDSGISYVWARGKTLGGSSSVNGMCYCRGRPEDYDHWETLGASGWNWRMMAPAFRAIEDHQLGATVDRGVGGPLHVSVNDVEHPFNSAVLAAAPHLGLPVRDDPNGPDQLGIGKMTTMIRRGRRVSAADAFLRPAMRRSNLRIMTLTQARSLRFEGRRAVGVDCEGPAGPVSFAARREVLVCAGAFESPKLLMLSGIGPAERLAELGIPVLQDSPGVGQNLAEHRGIAIQWRLRKGRSHNPQFSGLRLYLNGLRYALLKSGILSYGSHELMGFAKVHPRSATADTQFFISPFSRVMGAKTPQFEPFAGAQCLIYPTRPTSRGYLTLRSVDPAVPPQIFPRLLDTDYDRAVSVAMVRFIRKLAATEQVADFIAQETFPGPEIDTDETIIQAIRQKGTWGFHTVGTVRMGATSDPNAPLDPGLRVKGVEGVRVVDASAFPSIVSGNTAAPVSALAWNAADIIRYGMGLRSAA